MTLPARIIDLLLTVPAAQSPTPAAPHPARLSREELERTFLTELRGAPVATAA